MTSDGPHRISDREVSIAITGYFTPIHAPDAPVLIGMPGTDDLFVVVFSAEEKLTEMMGAFGIEYARVAIVTDGQELIDEMKTMNETSGKPYRIRLAVDPHRTDNGRMRYSEVLLLGDVESAISEES